MDTSQKYVPWPEYRCRCCRPEEIAPPLEQQDLRYISWVGTFERQRCKRQWIQGADRYKCHCCHRSVSQFIDSTMDDPCPPDWTFVVGDGGTYTFPTLVDIAYGSGVNFLYLYNVIGEVTFNSITFGGDPAPGATKSGYYRCPGPTVAPDNPPVVTEQPPPVIQSQYTPSYRSGNVGGVDALNLMTTLSQQVSSVDSQDPDGIKWISPSTWAAAVWDGVPRNPCSMTKGEICSYVFPNANTMRGLREKFYQMNPFADVTSPTPSEIDFWNIEIIRHLRSLFGITTPIEPDPCLYLRAQWGTERKYSQYWDASYSGTFDSAYGPCYGGANAHCGSTFVPSCVDQIPYLNGGPCCSVTAGAEGVFGTNANIPWSIKLTRIIASVICNEGLGGHAGPFFGRTKVGLAWHVQGAGVTLRAKWGGSLISPCP